VIGVKKTLATVIMAMGVVAILAGCGNSSANTASNNSTNSTSDSASGASASLKQQFVTVNAAAQSAIDDFNAGTSIEGAMDTATIDGKTYDVVATSKSNLDTLKGHYVDFMSSAAADELFKSVVQKGDKFVIEPSTATDNLNWYKATVSDVKTATDGSYVVTFSVPSTKDSTSTNKQEKIQKDSQGHLVFAGVAN
jgi:hypothetical protein